MESFQICSCADRGIRLVAGGLRLAVCEHLNARIMRQGYSDRGPEITDEGAINELGYRLLRLFTTLQQILGDLCLQGRAA